jgi:hypothetical protein
MSLNAVTATDPGVGRRSALATLNLLAQSALVDVRPTYGYRRIARY